MPIETIEDGVPAAPASAALATRHVAILMLAPFASGAEHQTLALCRYLSQRLRVTLLTNDEFANLLASDPFLRSYTRNLRIVRVGAAFPSAAARTLGGAMARMVLYPRLQLKLARVLRSLRPDLVHLVLAPSFFAYLPLFQLFRTPTIVTLAGEMRYVRRFYGAGKRLAVNLAVRRATQLVVCSADEHANLIAVQPKRAGDATVLDNFTDVARWAPSDERDRNLVTFAARLHLEKGAALFLEAAARVMVHHPEARFQLFGQGPEDAFVLRRIRELRLENFVTRGFVTDLSAQFAHSSIFVSCQLYENMGSSSLLEAMASGNAVVATDVGQTNLIVDDSVGLRVPVEPGALADAISRLLIDPDGTARRGQAARQRVLERYGPLTYVDRLLAVYDRAMLNRP